MSGVIGNGFNPKAGEVINTSQGPKIANELTLEEGIALVLNKASDGLKPCPFCGCNNPVMCSCERGAAAYVYVFCPKCRVKLPGDNFFSYIHHCGDESGAPVQFERALTAVKEKWNKRQ